MFDHCISSTYDLDTRNYGPSRADGVPIFTHIVAGWQPTGSLISDRKEYQYQTPEETLTMPITCQLHTYPAGGYVLPLNMLSGELRDK
jgi:hypothetical protein